MSFYRYPETQCVNCGKPLDSSGSLEPSARAPEPGDFTVCLPCGYLQVFGDNMKLRQLTSAEMDEVAANPFLPASLDLSELFRKAAPS